MNNLNRIWHPYWKWEETKFNMWGSVDNRSHYLQLAITFTGNANLYGECMLHVANEWTYSCEHNLTDRSLNRRAWIGHAACALAFRCPEDIVRAAWSELTEQQQVEANAKADEAIRSWECQRGISVKTSTKLL